MPVTISRAKFKDDTARWFPRYRSARMDLVLSRFELYERDTANKVNEGLLRKAVESWVVTDPKEFANRDKVSKGLCSQLADELGVKAQWDGSNREVISAHRLTCVTAGSGGSRAIADSAWLKCSLEDQMLQIHQDGEAGSTCVIVIDMQAKPGHTLNDGKTAYNSASVIDNQVSVLEAAAAYGMHVVEIRIATELNSKNSDDGPEVRVVHDDPTLPQLTDVMATVDKSRFVSIAKPFYNSFQGTTLEAELRERGITQAIVMGFDANLCVRNTIFGTPATVKYTKEGAVPVAYLAGLLDRGIPVLTSRVVLASSGGARLESDYRMTG
ncbi:MAG TPA: isochorismatase family protein [Burkholderiaceae bacterium]